jgi:hypothetical protein
MIVIHLILGHVIQVACNIDFRRELTGIVQVQIIGYGPDNNMGIRKDGKIGDRRFGLSGLSEYLYSL